MMMNLFSIFDPTTFSNLSLNWLSIFIFLFILLYQFWLLPSRITYLWNLFIMFFNDLLYFLEFKILINYSFLNIIIFISLILFLFFNNFLFPYIITTSSHMSFCLSMSLSLWMGLVLYSIMYYLNNLLTHLTHPELLYTNTIYSYYRIN